MLSPDDMAAAGRVALQVLGLDDQSTVSSEESWSGLSSDRTIILSTEDTQIFQAHLSGEMSLIDAVERIVDQVSNDISETDRFWGVAFPRCPGHTHPTKESVDGTDYVLSCPDTGDEVGRFPTDVAP